MLRRWWRAYWSALTNETNLVVTVSSGILWVVVPAASTAWFGSTAGTDIRLAFYEISATIIPVLLLAYFVEHATMTASIAKLSAVAPTRERKHTKASTFSQQAVP
jgi:hypothetical protein